MSANVRTTPCAKGFNGLLNVIYLKLSIDAQLVLEPFQFVIVQLQLSDSFQIASLDIMQFTYCSTIMQLRLCAKHNHIHDTD